MRLYLKKSRRSNPRPFSQEPQHDHSAVEIDEAPLILRWACRVVARCVDVASRKDSAFTKATARQSPLSATLRAKTGGKGIRTPDLLIANETLYQLSYTPEVFAAA